MAKRLVRPDRPFKAWAVEQDFDWGRALLGRFSFGHQIPVQFMGCRIALFETRAAARAAAGEKNKAVGPYVGRCRVVRVKVTIERVRADS